MEQFANIALTILAFMMSMFFISLVHEIGHYFVARVIMKEPDVKITMGFFGKPIFNSKRFRINAIFFWGAFVGGYSDADAKKSHMIMLFSSGAAFTALLAVPLALYVSGGISPGDFLPFFPPSPLGDSLFSVPIESISIISIPWLSLATPLDFFNMFVLSISNLIPFLILFAIAPYFYPLKLHGKWHLNPSDGMWVLKFIFNKVSEKDIANATAAINEKADASK